MSDLVDVIVPSLGQGLDTVLLVCWRVDAGARVALDEPLFEVETDKAVFEVEAEVDGVLVEALVAPGESVPAGAVIGRIRTG
jgi:pyruvate/2-oxoglutarate dehydrogenase complex dihydrolipoamide acyltransferase (E2) component